MQISNPRHIQIESYDYNLPDQRIAKYPLTERDSSKLLVYRANTIKDANFNDLPNFLPSDSLMVFNNTKVIQARLQFKKDTGARIEIFSLEPHHPADYQIAFQQTKSCIWLCFVGNSKKWKDGVLTLDIAVNGKEIQFTAERLDRVGDANEIRFSWNDETTIFADILDAIGELPIPPYLNRETEEADQETYQTVYSKIKGSVAAPTAGLHFTPAVLADIESRGMRKEEVTLHVGAGTFKPVQAEEIGRHEMHSELISVKKSMIEALLTHEGKIIAVGTTSVRTLESLYYLGLLVAKKEPLGELFVSQWMPYEKHYETSLKESLQHILSYLAYHQLDVLIAHTAIMIAPGYDFRVVDGIVTNFHQPKSTLLLLVSAFVGGNHWQDIYTHALANDYRFLSYGDSSLLLKD